jgi:hypothetical protein
VEKQWISKCCKIERILMGLFGWWGTTIFEFWKDIPPIFAVLNSNLNLDENSLFCCNWRSEVNLYEIPNLFGHCNQGHLCFGIDKVNTLRDWPNFTIYWSDMLPNNNEFFLLRSELVVLMLKLDEKRSFYI